MSPVTAEIVSHPLFFKFAKKSHLPFAARLFNCLYSLGGASYYLYDDKFSTKVLIFNYMSMFAGRDFSADWKMDIYSASGELVFRKSGRFSKQEMVVFDLDEVKPPKGVGIIIVHITPGESRALHKFYETVYFTEHYDRKNVWHDVAHSLRYPLPFNYRYLKTGWAITLIPDTTPYLILANSLKPRLPLPALAECRPHIGIINSKGAVRSFVAPSIPPLGCLRVNLREYLPDIHAHLSGKPGLIRVKGMNILEKPFFYQTNGEYISSDHL